MRVRLNVRKWASTKPVVRNSGRSVNLRIYVEKFENQPKVRLVFYYTKEFIKMEYSKLGSSGLNVSRCCLGTMTWGNQNNEAEGHEQMDYAITKGINFFDTAEIYAVPPSGETYGKTEEIIGTWLK